MLVGPFLPPSEAGEAAPSDGRVEELTTLVGERIAAVRQRIAAAGGDPGTIAIVAVTKGFGPEAPRAAVAAGLPDIGENYAQQLVAKAALVPRARWHFIGRVQRNKIKELAPIVHLWHSIDRIAVGVELARRRPGAGVLVQVNVSGEPQKGGCDWHDAGPLVNQLSDAGLNVRGLMAVGPQGPPEAARPGFRRLAALARSLELPHVSMGMTHDLEVAVQEGATIVRIGTALFGPRPGRAGAAR